MSQRATHFPVYPGMLDEPTLFGCAVAPLKPLPPTSWAEAHPAHAASQNAVAAVRILRVDLRSPIVLASTIMLLLVHVSLRKPKPTSCSACENGDGGCFLSRHAVNRRRLPFQLVHSVMQAETGTNQRARCISWDES
jgi:hypothetical protein